MGAALQVPESWQAVSDDRLAIPGCTRKRNVAGSNVYTIDGEDYLSTGGVLKLSPWGRVDHVRPEALAYGGARGSFVGLCCDLYDAGDLDWDGTQWEQLYDGKRVNGRPYVEAYANWREQKLVTVVEVEGLVKQDSTSTFGYRDRVWSHPTRGNVVGDLKTGAVLTDRERLQISSYATSLNEGCLLLQLTKQGDAVEHWVPDYPAYWARFTALAREAHEWLRQQEAR
jgi:hypothetical protein